MRINWTARSANTKTGDVPQAFVGDDLEECQQSCKDVDCPLYKKKVHDHECYAHRGRVAMGFWSVVRAKKRVGDQIRTLLRKKKLGLRDTRKLAKLKARYTLDEALKGALRRATIVRYTAIGDGGLVDNETCEATKRKVVAAGMEICGYTRAWKQEKAQQWRGWLMASCMNLEEADEALSKGWRASVVMPQDYVFTGKKSNHFTTPEGRKGVVCPHQIDDTIQCNECKLCVGKRNGPVIGFITHQ